MNKEIEQLINEFAKKRYQEGYDDGYKDGAKSGYMTSYQEGLNDAWEGFKRIAYPTCDGGLSADELYEIFRTSHISHILKNYLPSEIAQKIKDYEESQKQADAEIRVGDEVYTSLDENFKYIVTRIYRYDELVASLLSQNGTWGVMELSNLHKTGKHYDAMEEMLKELRRDEDNAANN